MFVCVMSQIEWNQIKGAPALEFCDSIYKSHTLAHLNLAHNSIGSDGAMVLGAAIMKAKVMLMSC